MSNKQPEALKLADILQHKIPSILALETAAAELRRLHTVNQQWKEKAATWLASPEAAARLEGYRDLAQQLNDALMQKDALVEALRKLSFAAQTSGGTAGRDEGLCEAIGIATAALAKAQGDGK